MNVHQHVRLIGKRRACEGWKLELADTNPDRALDLPAIVTYTREDSFSLSWRIFKTSRGCLCAEATN